MLTNADPSHLQCEVVPDRERVVVSLTGELDLASAPAVWKTLEELVPAGFATVTVDLSRLTFLDSAGLHALAAADRLAGEHECALTLVPGPDTVQRTFVLADLDRAFTFVPDGARA